jgi:hypothetical protein
MNKIDLHGIKHVDVQRTLDVFFWEMMKKNVSRVEVITGISQKMKDLVYEVCKDYNFKIIENPINSGSLFVDIK